LGGPFARIAFSFVVTAVYALILAAIVRTCSTNVVRAAATNFAGNRFITEDICRN
jgi:hypothetical protein